MSEHTPGPWKYGVRRDGSIWLSCGNPERGPHSQFDIGEHEPDACLIAAAPDLLAAAKQVAQWVDQNPATHPYDAWKAIEAAIAKADGRS